MGLMPLTGYLVEKSLAGLVACNHPAEPGCHASVCNLYARPDVRRRLQSASRSNLDVAAALLLAAGSHGRPVHCIRDTNVPLQAVVHVATIRYRRHFIINFARCDKRNRWQRASCR